MELAMYFLQVKHGAQQTLELQEHINPHSEAGGKDGFLTKFNSSGVRQWGTYYGSTAIDIAHGVATDGAGNVYISGYTSGTSGIASPGAYQTSYGGGTWDIYLAKFDGSGARQWCTYYGGTGEDVSYALTSDISGNVILTGYTESSGIASPGAYQTSLASTLDVIITKFDGAGSRQWATYYGGNGSDIANGIIADGAGNVFVTGNTGSTTGIATGDGHQTTAGGGGDLFVAEINNTGSALVYGTYTGGTTNDVGHGLAVDGAGNLYVAGFASSTTGITTSGAYQTVHGGGSWDALLMNTTYAHHQPLPPSPVLRLYAPVIQ